MHYQCCACFCVEFKSSHWGNGLHWSLAMGLKFCLIAKCSTVTEKTSFSQSCCWVVKSCSRKIFWYNSVFTNLSSGSKCISEATPPRPQQQRPRPVPIPMMMNHLSEIILILARLSFWSLKFLMIWLMVASGAILWAVRVSLLVSKHKRDIIVWSTIVLQSVILVLNLCSAPWEADKDTHGLYRESTLQWEWSSPGVQQSSFSEK